MLLLALVLSGCAHAPEGQHDTQFGKITGTVFYRERIALDPDAVVTVELADVSRTDAPAQPISTENIRKAVSVPVAFELFYDPMSIDAKHTYAVSAKITREGKLLWISETRHPVLTRGAPDTVDILVKRVASE